MTGHDLPTLEENKVEKFFHELTGAPLDPAQVRRAKVKEVEFWHTIPVCQKVDELEA